MGIVPLEIPLHASDIDIELALTGAAGDKYFKQLITNQTTVTISHYLGKLPSVTVIDSNNKAVIVEPQYISGSQITIDFGESFTGTVICN